MPRFDYMEEASRTSPRLADGGSKVPAEQLQQENKSYFYVQSHSCMVNIYSYPLTAGLPKAEVRSLILPIRFVPK